MSSSDGSMEGIALEPVPESERTSWVSVALIQAGCYICVPSLMLGALLVQAMPFSDAIIAGVLGYVISVAITCLIGFAGSDLHVPTCVIAQSTFGRAGARVILSLLFTLSLVGWFGVQAQVCGESFSNLMLTTFGVAVPEWVSTVVWGAVMLVTAVFGFRGMKVLNVVAIPALVICMAAATVIAVGTYGTEGLASGTGDGSLTILGGATLTASFLAVGMVIAPDYTRYQRSRGGVIGSSTAGILVPGLALMILGAVTSELVGQYDISLLLVDLGIPLAGMLVLILATWTTNTTNIYSAGLDIVMLFGLKDKKRALATVVAGLIGIVLTVCGVLGNLSTFLDWIGTAFMPIGGCMVADYWLLRHGRPEQWGYRSSVNVWAIVAWVAGVLVTQFLPVDGAMFIGFAVSVVAYAVLMLLFDRDFSAREVAHAPATNSGAHHMKA